MVDPRWRLLARLRLYCNASCIVAILVGGFVLCALAFHIGAPKWTFSTPGAMKPSSALGLIFLGMSLWLLLPDPPAWVRRHFGLFFGALAATLGAITLTEYMFGLSFQFNQVLFSRNLGAVAPYPAARMAPSTGTAFLALGLALLLLDWKTRRGQRPAQVLSLWGIIVAIMSLSGYIYKATAVFGIFSYTKSSMYTALAMFMMSAAIFFARPRVGISGDLTGTLVGSVMARRFLPPVIIIPILLGWIRVQGQRAGLFGVDLGLALNTTVNVATLSALLWLNARQLNKAEVALEEVREAGNKHYDASLRDELTGLYNRRGFLTFAEEQINLACSGRRELLVIFADVDGLKAINDNYGHPEGDRALKKAAEILLNVFRDTDIIARLGGDEFAVLALDCSPRGLARINAHFDKLLRAANDLYDEWKLSISIGAILVDSQHQLSIDDLLGRADRIMYERKRSRSVAVTG